MQSVYCNAGCTGQMRSHGMCGVLDATNTGLFRPGLCGVLRSGVETLRESTAPEVRSKAEVDHLR